MIKLLFSRINLLLNRCKKFDFIALLAIRLYLIPVIYTGAHSKVVGFSGTVTSFGEGGLNLPFPTLMAFMATGTEIIGLICIALGLFTRVMSVPMIFMMSAASALVHWSNGWLVVADKGAESSMRLSSFMTWLGENFPGRYNYLTELADPVMLNNGMEFPITYFVMFMVLFFYGGGRYVSADYWLNKRFKLINNG
ncbi:DoxX family protein [Shewanella psychropiezotolerans]|uniref:DoxX family protein n=1 Tax=Shewanella psychropiezotolerans TaxID=2593655 RepID=A0ABX5WV18_9GAMM|nr:MULTISPECIES: DoxX family protein [Shewanella]MPY22986.1 DoxX family protein [Shewanella sp. YLB-07]QDO82651.1 DoxX family protein [Shewanella psychropiezotolerans]